MKKLYGPLNNLAKTVDNFYGSSDGYSYNISKLYGSVNGVAKLGYIGLGEIPRPGIVTYYTDNTYATTATVRIITQADLDNLVGTSSSWTVTLEGVTISNDRIKEVRMPDWATSTPNFFLRNCSRLDKIENLFRVSTLGQAFLENCSSFNQAIDLTRFTTIPNNFLKGCSSFNQPIDLSTITSIGNYFLSGTNFNQTIDLTTVTEIGDNFLSGTPFNQDFTIPNTVTSIGTGFLYNCDSMVGEIVLDAPETVASTSNNTFSTTDANADCYTTGISVIGTYARQWMTRFPNRDTTPYRNLVLAAHPELIDLDVIEDEDSIKIDYGVTTWDVSGTYDSGTIILYGGTQPNPSTQIDSYSSIGRNVYYYSPIVGNTTYYYKSVATNSGGISVENSSSIVTKPGIFEVQIRDTAYASYNQILTSLTIAYPASGQVYPQTVEYRMKKSTDSNWGSWVLLDTYTGAGGDKDYEGVLTRDADTIYDFEFRVSTPAGSQIVQATKTAYPSHQGPTNVQFTFDDSNSDVQNWLSNYSGYSSNTWFISGQSTPRVTIPIATAGELADETYLYIGLCFCGYSTTVPQGGTQLVDYSALTRTGGTSTSNTNGYIALRVQVQNLATTAQIDAVQQEILNSIQIIDTTTQENVFEGDYLYGYWENSGANAGKIVTQSTSRSIIYYAPCISGRTYTVSYKTTGATTLSQYQITITSPNNGYSDTIPYDSQNDMVYVFAKQSIASRLESGNVNLTNIAEDSLGATTTYTKQGVYLTWNEPTFLATAERTTQIGGIKITFEGAYSGLYHPDLNNGQDLNSVALSYRVIDYAGNVITDWTNIPYRFLQLLTDSNAVLNRTYSGTIDIQELQYTKSVVVEVKASDHFSTKTISINLGIWEGENVLNPPAYDIEIWDWKTNTFVMDVSHIIADPLNIEWELNDVEQISFSLDLLQFEKKCQEIGSSAKEIMKPYARDVRIRRNGEYIVGGQIVEADVKIPNNPPTQIQVKCTGFLNLFKDQYIMSEAWSGYSYADIARKLIQTAQKPDCLIKNPTADIDTSYWLCPTGTVSYSTNSYNGAGCLMGSRSGTGWITLGTQMTVDSGTPITIDLWVKAQSGATMKIIEREYITQGTNQVVVANFTGKGSWQHIICDYTTFFENGYFAIEVNRTNTSDNLFLDNVYIYAQDDDITLCNMNVNLGIDTASASQSKTRQVNYELQNVKDALMDLTQLEEDNFDFDFSPDRTFNRYARKGEDKLNLEVCYPGNIDSMTITRSATSLANKVYNIGSGIGDERLQVGLSNKTSRQIYGTRESIDTNSNVSLKETLITQAVGDLYDRKDPTDLPQITISDGSINPANVQVGDRLLVTAEGDDFLSTINDIYRVVKIKLEVSLEAVEKMSLTLEPPVQRPQQKMVRYIRDSLKGNSLNVGNHWCEIQALMMVGNEFVNVAQGATVYGSGSWENNRDGIYATDGSLSTWAAMAGPSSITIDLGAEYPIDYIKIWHYYPDGRTYYGEHLSVGTSLPDSTTGTQDLETLLWSYADGTGYKETSSGKTSRWLQEGEIEQGTSEKKIRYIKDTLLSNSVEDSKSWFEIEALVDNHDGTFTNVALNKTVTCTGSTTDSLSNVTDGNTSTGIKTTDTGYQSVLIDLGAEYVVDYIKIWHHYSDNRTYYGETLSVGTESTSGNDPLETILWSNADDEGYMELSVGRKSQWIQGL